MFTNKPHTKVEFRGIENVESEQTQVAIAGKRNVEYVPSINTFLE